MSESTIPIGAGRAYSLALSFLRSKGSTMSRRGSYSDEEVVLEALAETFEELHPGITRTRPPSLNVFRDLNTMFDIDSIISFSDAWSCWEQLPVRPISAPPLDQELFKGSDARSVRYFQGIRNLARRTTPEAVAALSSSGLHPLGNTLLDIGAGPAVYPRELVLNGFVKKATCVDFPNVVSLFKTPEDNLLAWIPCDAQAVTFPSESSFDVIWLGNILHHYCRDRNLDLFSRIRTCLADPCRVVVQEYPLRLNQKASISAAILGLHFLLTTDGARTLTDTEIISLVTEGISELSHEKTLALNASALFIFTQEQE